jgi:hypothetical protein
VREFSAPFETAKNKPGNEPVTLVKIDIPANGTNPALTLRLADRRSPGNLDYFVTPQNNWLDLIIDYDIIDSSINANQGSLASDRSARLTIGNVRTKLFSPEAQFSILFHKYIPETAIVTIYQYFEEVGFDETDMEPEHVGRIATPASINLREVSFDVVELSNEFGKRRIGNVIDLSAYPDAPDESIGKFIKIPFGVMPKVPTNPIFNAVETQLKAALTVGQTSIPIADASGLPVSGSIVIDNDEISYTGKSGNTLTGLSGITQTHYNGDTVLEKINSYDFLISDPEFPIKDIDSVYARVNDKYLLIDSTQYTKDVANGKVNFTERPFYFNRNQSQFLQTQFDSAGAGNTASDPLNAIDPEQPTATAKINQATSLLVLKQTTIMAPLGEILSVKVFIAHYEDGQLPNDSLSVDIVGLGQIGLLAKPGTEESTGDVSANLDFTHTHLDDIDFIFNEGPHFHGLEFSGNFPVFTDQVISASIVVNPGGVTGFGTVDGIVDFNESLGGFRLRNAPFGASGQGASLANDVAVQFSVLSGVSDIGSVTYSFNGVPGGGIDINLFTTNANFTNYINVFLDIGSQSFLIYKSLFGKVPEVWLKTLTVPGAPESNTAKLRISATVHVFDQFATAGWGLAYQQITRDVFETPPSGTDNAITGGNNNKAGKVEDIVEDRDVSVVGGNSITRGANDRFDITSLVNGDWGWFTNKELQVKYNGVLDGVTTYIAHAAFEIEYVLQQKTYVEQICADVQGVVDDGLGTVTGTPNLMIEKPDHLFKWSLLKGLDLPASFIDTDSFDLASNQLATEIPGGYKFAGAIEEKNEIRSFWRKWARECRSLFHFERGKAKLYFLPKNGTVLSTDINITEDDIVAINGEDQITLERGREDDVINSIDLRYKPDLLTGDYNGVEKGNDALSITNYGKREKPEEFEFDWVRNPDLAANLCQFFLAEHKNVYSWCSFSTTLHLMQIDRFDFIGITHPLIGEIGLRFPCMVAGPSRQLGHGENKRPDLMKFLVRIDGAQITIIPPATAKGKTVNPIIEITGGFEVTPLPAIAKSKTNNPLIVLGSVSITPTPATAIGKTINPTVVNIIVVTPPPATASGKTKDPSIFLDAVLVIPAPAKAKGSTTLGAVLSSSITITPAPATAKGTTLPPTILQGNVFDDKSGLFDDAPGFFDNSVVIEVTPPPATARGATAGSSISIDLSITPTPATAKGKTIFIVPLFDDEPGNFDDKTGNFDNL